MALAREPWSAESENRIGVMYVAPDIWLEPSIAACLMPRIIPVKVEYDYARAAFAITAYSNDFAQVPKGAVPSRYDVVLEMVQARDGSWAQTILKEIRPACQGLPVEHAVRFV